MATNSLDFIDDAKESLDKGGFPFLLLVFVDKDDVAVKASLEEGSIKMLQGMVEGDTMKQVVHKIIKLSQDEEGK